MKKLCAIAVFVALFMAVPAFGDGVNIGASGSSNNILSNPLFGLVDELGAQFTLTSTTQVNSVSLGISDFDNNPYSVAIVGSLGGPALWTSSVTSTDDPSFNSLALTLNAGTYYLVGPASGGSSLLATWNDSNDVLSQVGGTVGSGYWYNVLGLGWANYANGGPLQFDVSGTTTSSAATTATPEPASLPLFLTGLIGLVALCYRKRAFAGAR